MATDTTTRATALSFQSITFDVVDHAGGVWLRAADIARALEYSRANKVTSLYERNADEFTSAMTAIVENPTPGLSGNLTTKSRIFSLRGAHLIAMFARTPKAKQFRQWVLDVLDKNSSAGIPVTMYDKALDVEKREAVSFALAQSGSRAMLMRKGEKNALVRELHLMREVLQLRLALGYGAQVAV